MIKAVLFDYGGVLAAGGRSGQLEQNLAKHLDIDEAMAAELIRAGYGKFKRGDVNEDEFWTILEREFGQMITPSQREIWATWKEVKPLPDMYKLRDELITNGYQVGILSNTEPHVASMLKTNGAYDDFSPVVLSYEVGYAKPDKEIYQLAIEQFQLQPEEILFIDDQIAMLEPARELGMQIIHAQTHLQTIRDIRSFTQLT